jgi:hypothetical protein
MQAITAGLTETQVWNMTPGQVLNAVAAAARRRKDEERQDAWMLAVLLNGLVSRDNPVTVEMLLTPAQKPTARQRKKEHEELLAQMERDKAFLLKRQQEAGNG